MQPGVDRAPDGRPVRGREPVRRVEQGAVDVEHQCAQLFLLVCFCMVRSHMARLKIAYIGGGSTRGAGTMASFIEQGENFSGSEIVLIDLDADRLELIRSLAQRLAIAKGVDITVSATTDRRAGLDACDAVLTSYRPGGFEARVLDERIPLDHGVIGQETQGPGGFFMALRSIHVMQGILEDVAVACPGTRIFNYTNPVNLVAQAVTDHSDVPFVSLCEGPIVFPEELAEVAGLDPARLDVASVGPQPRLLERAPHLRRRRTCCRCSRRPTRAAATTPRCGPRRAACCASRPSWTRCPASTSSTTTSRTRCSAS